MSGQKHTEGTRRTWSVQKSLLSGGHYNIESIDRDANEGSVICEMSGPDAKANAEFICRAKNSHEALVEALKAMVDEQVDYMTINNLGDPEKQHNIKLAQAALKAAGEGGEG